MDQNIVMLHHTGHLPFETHGSSRASGSGASKPKIPPMGTRKLVTPLMNTFNHSHTSFLCTWGFTTFTTTGPTCNNIAEEPDVFTRTMSDVRPTPPLANNSWRLIHRFTS